MKFTESERLQQLSNEYIFVALIHHHALIKQLVEVFLL